MDYLTLLQEQPGTKTALITDEKSYTYAELAREALAERYARGLGSACGDQLQRTVRLIRRAKIAGQLLEFLAYSGTREVPVIATQASAAEDFTWARIPQAACMGVMTSGSMGRSKLLWRSYASWADFFACQNAVFGIDAATVIFCQGSLAFTGNLSIYLGVFAAGGTAVATEKFSPRHWLTRMDTAGANSVYLIPAKLMLLPRAARGPRDAIRHIVSGSQSMGLEEAGRLKSIFPQAELTLYYGASELNYITYIKDGEMTEDRTLVGRPFPGVEVFVEGEEIFVVNKCAVEGITLPYSLGDRGRLDAEGRLHFLGRKDDVCNVNGLKISSAKVENALMQVLRSAEAAVVAARVRDADVLTAFITGERRMSKQELLRLLRPHLAGHELPGRFVFVEKLPRNESGKTDKQRLRNLACRLAGVQESL